jgi:hypothetical protein
VLTITHDSAKPHADALFARSSSSDSQAGMGALILGGWIVVGLAVAGYERTRAGADSAFETQLCVVGAIAGGFAGQITRWYVFGEPLGFVFAAAGAELLLRSYRRRTAAAASAPVPAPEPASPLPAPVVDAPSAYASGGGSPLLRGLEAFAWGVFSACVFAAAAVAGEMAAERVYLLNEPHAMSLLFYVPIGLVIGFVIGVSSCLREPRRTIPQMLVFLAIVAFVWGAVIMTLGKWDASYEHGPVF